MFVELTLYKASIDSKFASETHGGTKRLNPKETVIKALELDPNHSSSFLAISEKNTKKNTTRLVVFMEVETWG